MARSPSSTTIEAFPKVRPIAAGQTGAGSTQTVMAKNPRLFPIQKSGFRMPGASAEIDTKGNLAILKK